MPRAPRMYSETLTTYAQALTLIPSPRVQPLMQPLRGAGFSDGMQHLDIYYKPDNIDEHNKLPVRNSQWH